MTTMGYPGPMPIVLVVALAIVVVGADIVLRLVVAPRRREAFINELLDCFAAPSAESEPAASAHVLGPSAPDLTECLLRHFERSSISKQILVKLAEGEQGLGQRELSAMLNRSQADRNKPALPLSVARRVAITLLHAGLIGVEAGTLRITNPGRQLNHLLQLRKESRLRPVT